MAGAVVAIVVLASATRAQPFGIERVASGLALPVFLTAPPGDATRAFILEQHAGTVRILRLADDSLLATPFLTVPGISTGYEQGVLGLAFHPDYASNGFFYVYLTDPDSHIVRYQVSPDPDVADATSATPVLSYTQPQSNHNAGWIGFGPDGYLYITSGDGGGSHDNDSGHTSGTGNAQDVSDNLLGKLLRIDVDADDFPGDAQRNYAIPPDNPFLGTSGDDEIWAFGLRNPWRASFDAGTGDLYIADVGQSTCEEIDVQPASSGGGENYGWRLREGTIATIGSGVGGAAPPGAVDPIMDYSHGGAETCSDPGPAFTGRSITGGYVYRGPIAALDGRYFFADFFTAELWSLLWDGSDPSGFDGTNYSDLTDHTGDPDFTPDFGNIDSVASFGEDDEGNLYVLDHDGEVFRLPEPRTPAMLLVGIGTLLGLSRRRRQSGIG